MEIYSIWESMFPSESAGEGLAVTEAIWADMPDFDGYRDHMILVDQDDQGHVLVVSRWASREHADKVLRQYSPHPKAQAADRLVSQPRRRFVAVPARRGPN